MVKMTKMGKGWEMSGAALSALPFLFQSAILVV